LLTGDDQAETRTVWAVDRSTRLRLALAINGLIVVVQFAFGLVAHSIGLLADAAHNLTDVAGLIVALIAVQWLARPPTPRRSFGYHRGTILAALTNAAMVLGTTVLIAYEAIRRFADPQPVRGGVVVIVALVALVANSGAVLLLHDGSHDLNMRAALLHMVADAGVSAGVAIAGAAILVTGGFYWLDPLASLAIGVLIAIQAWRLLRDATNVLLESSPDRLDLEQLIIAMDETPGIDAVHDLHVWSLSSEITALSAHLVLSGHPTLEEAQVVGASVKARIEGDFGIAHSTLELECEPCVDELHDIDAGLRARPGSHPTAHSH
jgi:cobalt-zinc-cadmium efflux system protein